MDSSDRMIASLPVNKNGLRPPFVWNFPIERIEEIREKTRKDKEKIEEVHRNKNKRMTKKQPKPKLDIVFKEEVKKNEIRKINAYNYYHDGRIEKFIDLFDELYNNCMKYAKTKGNTWEYVYCKILQVFGIEYAFSQPKEEATDENNNNEATNTNNDEQAKKEGENKEEKKEGENKEGNKEGENKEENKEGENNEEIKGEENNEEKKEGEIKEDNAIEEEKNNEDDNKSEVIIINSDQKNEEGKNNEELVTESNAN